jgi:hypothetical protein
MHGVAHLVGTSEAWATLGENGAVRYLFEQWHLTTTPMLVTAGVVWALVAAGFLATAVAVWANRLRWRQATLLMASVSLVLCLLALPQAAMGLIVNGSLIAVVTRLLALQQKAGR